MRLLRVWIVAVAAGVIGVGCGTSSPHHPKSINTPQRTSTSSSTAAPTSTSTTLAAAGSTACGQVTAADGGAQGGAGTIIGSVTVVNAGAGSCTMLGYPVLARFGPGGTPVHIMVVDGLTVNVSGPASQPPALVTLAPGAHAQFNYQFSDVPTGSETTCASSTTLGVTTPGATAPAPSIPVSMAPCSNGTVDVSPLFAAG